MVCGNMLMSVAQSLLKSIVLLIPLKCEMEVNVTLLVQIENWYADICTCLFYFRVSSFDTF
jgi:hypothetical protein